MPRNSLDSPFSRGRFSCARFLGGRSILSPGCFSVTAAMLIFLFLFLVASSVAHAQSGTEYIVTNEIGIGLGILGGYFAAPRILATNVGGTDCVFASAAYFGEITGVAIDTQQVVGNFAGSATDSGFANGIGLAMNQSYLYAGYSTSGTIGTFSVAPDCSLSFIGDVTATGVNGGTPDGMALHGNLLVVTYEDGSMESCKSPRTVITSFSETIRLRLPSRCPIFRREVLHPRSSTIWERPSTPTIFC